MRIINAVRYSHSTLKLCTQIDSAFGFEFNPIEAKFF